jgi:hypothetical protein
MEVLEDLVENCSLSANIVCDPVFESAANKIQRHQILNEELNLSSEESRAVEHLKVRERQSLDQQIVEIDDDEDPKEGMDIILSGIKKKGKFNLDHDT